MYTPIRGNYKEIISIQHMNTIFVSINNSYIKTLQNILFYNSFVKVGCVTYMN